MKKIPMRKCIGCNEMKAKKDLIRIVKSTEGTVFVDSNGKTDGRGAYLCRSMECMEKSLKNKGLERSFKCGITKEIKELLIKEMETAIAE